VSKRWMSYHMGDWVLVPVRKIELPRVKLTPEQEQENREAEVRHAQNMQRIDGLIAQLESFGVRMSADDDEGGSAEIFERPKLVLPHDPNTYDFSKFGPQEWAYANWLDDSTYRSSTAMEKLTRDLVKAGIKVTWEFQGLSAGEWPIPKKDIPPLPEWAK